MKNWTIYILRCRGGALYTGITEDLKRRIEQHNSGTGAKYTRANSPCDLVWSRSGLSESSAKKEEARIKRMTKKEKEDVILGSKIVMRESQSFDSSTDLGLRTQKHPRI